MGSPPNEPERRPGEDQVEVTLTKGFLLGKFEVTQGDWQRVVGKLPGPLKAELPAGGRVSRGERQLRRNGNVLPKAGRTGPLIRRPSPGLGVPAADRGAVGICLPGRNDHGDLLRRQSQQRASEFQRKAVQRGRSGAIAGHGRKGGELPGERVGTARHARQHL